jgi:hypothetical protein
MHLDLVYRGKKSDSPLELDVAFAVSGNVNIELMTQLNDGPRALRDMFNKDKFGLHHTALFADDFEQECEKYQRAGFPTAMEISLSTATRVAFADTRKPLGHMTERISLIPLTP